jgi:hypothetical protein
MQLTGNQHQSMARADQELLRRAHTTRDRAASMRRQAESLPEVLADSYKRRAAELELEAWIAEVQSGIPYDEVHSAA